ncbi:MAG: hypothetical protein Kow00128_18660 [Deltaproteobacteria bacterium]
MRPDIRSDEAALGILRSLYQVVRDTVSVLGEDRDPEDLHDFRVALRRTRTALRHLEKVFPDGEARLHRKRLASVMRGTGPLRDLDVLLRRERAFRGMVPPEHRKDLPGLFDALRKRRAQIFRTVRQALEEESTRATLSEWKRFLDRPPGGDDPPRAALPIGKLAGKRIRRQYRRVLRAGDDAGNDPSDSRLHRLRIECKELRYLLEFFSGLFPPSAAAARIRSLKRLQDLLGGIHDLREQERLLRSALRRPSRKGGEKRRPDPPGIGMLFEAIGRERRILVESFGDAFRTFRKTSPPP